MKDTVEWVFVMETGNGEDSSDQNPGQFTPLMILYMMQFSSKRYNILVSDGWLMEVLMMSSYRS